MAEVLIELDIGESFCNSSFRSASLYAFDEDSKRLQVPDRQLDSLLSEFRYEEIEPINDKNLEVCYDFCKADKKSEILLRDCGSPDEDSPDETFTNIEADTEEYPSASTIMATTEYTPATKYML